MVNSDPSFQTQTIELDTEKDIELFAHFIWLMQFNAVALEGLLMRVTIKQVTPKQIDHQNINHVKLNGVPSSSFAATSSDIAKYM